jgi:hypothetical protein
MRQSYKKQVLFLPETFSPDGSGNPFGFLFRKPKDCSEKRETAPQKIPISKRCNFATYKVSLRS